MRILPAHKAFLGEEQVPYPNYEQAKAIIIPFGLEKSVSYGLGASKGPQAIIDASVQLEMFDEQFWCEPCQEIGILTLEEPDIDTDLPRSLVNLDEIVHNVLADNKFPLVLGGEHSITAGAVRPFSRKYKDLAILHFDAHADLRDGYLGERYSHASALRRCLDDANIEKNGHHIELISCGIRSISSEEIPFLEENRDRIFFYWGKDKESWDYDQIVSHLKGKDIYLTFDIDAFDPSLIPATGTPEPGGLFWNEAIDIITRASQNGNIVGADVNELAPIKGLHSCDFIAAKLVYKILAIALCGR